MSRRGKDEANPDLQIADVLPLAALDERVAIVGTSGAGKTYASKSWIERLLEAGVRVCVVDPLGVWWGLRAGADGATPGYPVVVFGGRHADIELDESMGAALGHLVGGRRERLGFGNCGPLYGATGLHKSRGTDQRLVC